MYGFQPYKSTSGPLEAGVKVAAALLEGMSIWAVERVLVPRPILTHTLRTGTPVPAKSATFLVTTVWP